MCDKQRETLAKLLLALIPLGGCMTTHSFEAVEPPQVVFKDEQTMVGLIDAKEGQQNPSTPTLQTALYRGIQDAIGSRMEVRAFDLRSQQHEIRWSRKPDFFDKVEAFFTFTPAKAPEPFLIFGPNAQIEPPLLVSINYAGNQKNALYAYVMFWTRSGVLLDRNFVTASIDPSGFMALKVNDKEIIGRNFGITGHPYERTEDGSDARSMAPSDDSQQFLFMLKHSYGALLYPYLPHKRPAQIIFIEEPSSVPDAIALAKQNRFADAYTAFMKVAYSNPKHHGALCNAAQLKWALGDSKTAAELMKKANAISSSGLSRGWQEQYEREAAGSKIIDANAPPPPPPPPAE